jgi:hypothetical protein
MINTKEINIFSGSYATGSDGQITSSIIAARWEIDPDDGKSIQLRIPSGSAHGGATDRIAFYVSASGDIGINTKTPTSKFQIATTASEAVKQGPTDMVGNFSVTGNITSSGIISSSGALSVLGIDGGTF